MLAEIGVEPGHGQNFLDDARVIEALVESGEVEGCDVLEIGPGTGAITGELLQNAKSVTAFEKDPRLASYLEEKFPELDLVKGDFLEVEEIEQDRCVSNIPFEITSEVVEKLGAEQVQSALIVQKELAEKAVAEPGESGYGPFSVMCRYYFVPVKLREVGSRSFYPSPEVDAAILKLYPNEERHGVGDREEFFRISRALFTHKRKKVRNAFVDARHILDYSKEGAKDIRDELPHSESRVIDLDIREFAEIMQFLQT